MTDRPRDDRLFVWPSWQKIFALALVGLVAGFLSGMFGVGGGIVIIPGLTMALGYDPRLASGTSLAAIIPLAAVGVASYATSDSVSWLGALLLALGGLVGTQLGAWLLTRVSARGLQMGFSIFMVVSAFMLFVNVPSRDAVIHIDPVIGAVLVLIGFGTGILSGLMGIGGGIIVVPALMLIVGASDLVAKGTSLLMMIPAAIGGTIPNYRRGNVDLAAALIVSATACTTTVLGTSVAQMVTPMVANICFALLIVVMAVRMMIKALRTPKAR